MNTSSGHPIAAVYEIGRPEYFGTLSGVNAITAVALSALALLGGFHRGLTPPPAPGAALPSTPVEAAEALVSTDASLRAAIDRWLASGAARPTPDVTLYALYEQRLYR